MGLSNKVILIIVGMAVVTYIPRVLPLIFFSKKKIPDEFIKWLEFIPVTLFAALIFPELFTKGNNPRVITFLKPEFFAFIPTIIFAIKTKSLALTIIFGTLVFWGIESFLKLT